MLNKNKNPVESILKFNLLKFEYIKSISERIDKTKTKKKNPVRNKK